MLQGAERTIGEREARRIREVARALLREMREQGHICLKAEVIGGMASDIATVKLLVPKVDKVATDIADIKGQWRGVGIALTVIAVLPAIGWIVTLLVK